MLTIRLRAALAAGLLFVVPLSALAQGGDIERLRIHGSNTMGTRLMPALVQSWLESTGYEGITRRAASAHTLEIRAERDGVPLIVEIGKRGSAAGMADLIDGNAELAMMSREPDARELDAAWQLGDLASPDQEHVVAIDGIAVIVNAGNPVRQLSTDQLRAIYAGRIRNWMQLGGADRPIHMYLAGTRSASGEFFRAAVMAKLPLAREAGVQVAAAQVTVAVAADPGAIGIVGLRARVSNRTRPLAISSGGLAVYPTPLDILSEDYPLTRRYSLYGGQLMSALGRSFALFATTRRAQEAVAVAGHFAVTLRPAPQSPLPKVGEDYARMVAGAHRLPLSLRFNLAGTQSIFDSRAANDLDRLVAFMQLPQNLSRQAVVVAFGSHDNGGAMVSTLISNDRADIIAGYLQEHGVAVRSANGLGPLRPLAAVGQQGARFRNERVEVWLL